MGTEAGLGCGQGQTSALSAVTNIPHYIGRHRYSALYRPSQIFRIVLVVTNIPHCIGRHKYSALYRPSQIFALYRPSQIFRIVSAVTNIQRCIGHHKYSALYRPSQIFRFVSAVTNIHLCIGRCQAEHENGMHKTRQNDITTTLNFFGRFTGQLERFHGIGILHLCLSQIPLVVHVCSTGHGSPPKR